MLVRFRDRGIVGNAELFLRSHLAAINSMTARACVQVSVRACILAEGMVGC